MTNENYVSRTADEVLSRAFDARINSITTHAPTTTSTTTTTSTSTTTTAT